MSVGVTSITSLLKNVSSVPFKPQQISKEMRYNHRGRTLEHDALCRRLESHLSTRGYAAHREYQFDTRVEMRKPDMDMNLEQEVRGESSGS